MKVLIMLALLAIAAPGLTRAQDTIPLTFEEAVDIGLKRNVNYQTTQNQQEVLRMSRLNAQLQHLPAVSLSSNLNRQVGQQFQQVEGEVIVTNQINDIIRSGFNSRIPVFNGFQLLNQTKASRFFEEAGEYALSRLAEELSFTIARQYLQVLLDEQLHAIARENLDNQKKQLEQIAGFVKAGLRTLSDQYNQQSEVARLETVALNARIQWETDLWTLAETLQLEPNVIPWPQKLEEKGEFWMDMDLQDLYELAGRQRKDLKEQQLLEQGSQKLVAAAKGSMYPQLSAFFNYNTFFTSLDNRTISDQLLTVYPQRTFGFSLLVPVFGNFDNKAAVSRARVDLTNQKLEREALQRKIVQEVKLARENYRAAMQTLYSTKAQLLAAEQAMEAISERFRLGVSNFVDLAQANQQLVRAQSDLAQAKFTLYFQGIVMDYALGSLR
ncbi:outer membrane protein [Cyclobacterium lianum]|uniref:Outer membrane protein n=1 Tax=Cyclobacterium lianum TaxID=388280 RepID=A0A1M7N5F9_9BACT|nr:TolC family protein [Cyclobacterium lianum]SHM98831.1 outer membrane protein [Cyclobacterium lianum]